MDWIHQIRPHEVFSTIAICFLGWKVWQKSPTEDTTSESLKGIVNTIGNKSKYYKGHSTRVGLICKALCDAMDIHGQERQDCIEAGYLHDIGKIRLDLALLNKEEKLTETDWKLIKDHSVVGYDILKDFNVNKEVLANVLYHHENVDGTGYPLKLADVNIPMGAKIIRIADSIDAMGSDRAYRDALSFEVITEELIKGKGTMYDETIIDKATNGLSPRIRLILAQQRV